MEQIIIINSFIDALSSQEKRELLDWIDACDDNRREYLELRKVWDMYLLNRAPEEPSVSFSQILAEYNRKLEGKKAPKTSRPVRWLRELGKIAAVFVVAVGLSWYMYTNHEPAPDCHTIEVPSGQRVKLSLSDGTLVWLNAQTKFTYPSVFGKKSRRVTLDGEGLFEVAHQAGLPFIVQTAKREVTVLGTTFDVYAYSNSDAFETILLNGSVQVADLQPTGKTYRLQPRDKIFYNEETNQMQTVKVNPDEYVAWKDGVYYFNDLRFAEMAKRLEHYYKTRIIINDSTVMNYRCTGKFRQHESITDIMNVVKSDMPFTYTYDKDLNELIIHQRTKKRQKSK